MATIFDVICEDFHESLDSVRHVIDAFDTSDARPKTRIASINSATLFLAATFEEFVREIAREYAKKIVRSSGSLEGLPTKFAESLWFKSLDGVSRLRHGEGKAFASLNALASDAQQLFTSVFAFLNGDLNQEVYRHLIHNERNMRYSEINSMFNSIGLQGVCSLAAATVPLSDFYQETEPGKVNREIMRDIDSFVDRRNEIAHSVTSATSVASDVIRRDIERFRALSAALVVVCNR